MFKFRLNKHDRYLQELCDKIKYDYESISTNVKIINRKRSLGEIDILAKKGDSYDLYEVKCSYRITKARKQASSIKKHLNNIIINNAYFYCGATASLILL